MRALVAGAGEQHRLVVDGHHARVRGWTHAPSAAVAIGTLFGLQRVNPSVSEKARQVRGQRAA